MPSKVKLLNHGLNETVRLTRLYRRQVAPKVKPVDTEGFISVDIGVDLPLKGRLDVEEGDGIRDLKGASRSWPKGRAGKEIQPAIYTMLFLKKRGIHPTFIYDVLVALQDDEKHQVISDDVTRKKLKATLAVIYRVMRSIESGVFNPCDPTSWVCSERFCGYYLTCPYVGNGHQAWI